MNSKAITLVLIFTQHQNTATENHLPVDRGQDFERGDDRPESQNTNYVFVIGHRQFLHVSQSKLCATESPLSCSDNTRQT